MAKRLKNKTRKRRTYRKKTNRVSNRKRINKKKTVDNPLNPTAKPSILSIKLKAFVKVVIQKIVNNKLSHRSISDFV